ncbi:hypothetical protein MGYG_03316 [Nannizzia gypsea CBS 118893]|uniref:Uncharacterized protein n=1 Tax=Arthroderma gypseum (strain ATCC MYA-4604 / CBS 118893) TaxID=535722 RepID=E4UN13_ARTGP|nr:hypothetical protein MGYG_03316 [Nannizzia gypsea CBS 118893]EFR00315.1 hypothetical protein MGYG_03316 [Nannizzia gypsea CBS 118893]
MALSSSQPPAERKTSPGARERPGKDSALITRQLPLYRCIKELVNYSVLDVYRCTTCIHFHCLMSEKLQQPLEMQDPDDELQDVSPPPK